jgi:hypothetical protein
LFAQTRKIAGAIALWPKIQARDSSHNSFELRDAGRGILKCHAMCGAGMAYVASTDGFVIHALKLFAQSAKCLRTVRNI